MSSITFHPTTNLPDAKLVSLYSEGDDMAAALLFNRYFGLIRRVIASIVKDYKMTEELEIETFITAFSSLRDGSFASSGLEFKSYLISVSKDTVSRMVGYAQAI